MALCACAAELPPELAVVVGYPRVTERGERQRCGHHLWRQLQLNTSSSACPIIRYSTKSGISYLAMLCRCGVIKAVVALSICEDIWHEQPAAQAKAAAGAEVLINLNASPFTAAKQLTREQVVSERRSDRPCGGVNGNQVGGSG